MPSDLSHELLSADTQGAKCFQGHWKEVVCQAEWAVFAHLSGCWVSAALAPVMALLFIYFFVSLSARLCQHLPTLWANSWTDLHEIFREGAEWPRYDLITFLVNSEKPCDEHGGEVYCALAPQLVLYNVPVSQEMVYMSVGDVGWRCTSGGQDHQTVQRNGQGDVHQCW